MGWELNPMTLHILNITLVKYSYQNLKLPDTSMTVHSRPWIIEPYHELNLISKYDAQKVGSTPLYPDPWSYPKRSYLPQQVPYPSPFYYENNSCVLKDVHLTTDCSTPWFFQTLNYTYPWKVPTDPHNEKLLNHEHFDVGPLSYPPCGHKPKPKSCSHELQVPLTPRDKTMKSNRKMVFQEE